MLLSEEKPSSQSFMKRVIIRGKRETKSKYIILLVGRGSLKIFSPLKTSEIIAKASTISALIVGQKAMKTATSVPKWRKSEKRELLSLLIPVKY